jgi:phospholipid/cholesterol/gamma-HCH transport system substrate-binding protein/paraquat-inducible protein B
MEDSKRYQRLGLFVGVTVLIAALILFLLGGRSLFQPKFTFETYFAGSVAGLEVGSPVRLRGVPLGQVSEIMTSSALYEKGVPIEKRKTYIVVRAVVSYDPALTREVERDARQMIERGMRVQTQLAGITGQQYLSLDFFDPAKSPPLPFDWTPEHQYIPSAPSLTAEIVANAQNFLAQLNEADIKDIGQNLNKLIVTVNAELGKVHLDKLAADADATLSEARATISRVDRILAAAPIDDTVRKLDSAATRLDSLLANPNLERTVDNLGEITGQLRKLSDSGDLDRLVRRVADAADRLDGLIGDNQYDVRVMVQDLRATADNLRVLSENIKRYPAGALVGGPPDKVQLPARSQ